MYIINHFHLGADLPEFLSEKKKEQTKSRGEKIMTRNLVN